MAVWHLDEGYRLDEQSDAEFFSEASLTMDLSYTALPFSDAEGVELVSEAELSISIIQARAVDLLEFVPEKFRNEGTRRDYTWLTQYIEEASTQVGSWLSATEDIVKLLNADTVGTVDYLRKLGAIIGVEFSPEDDTTTAKMRMELSNALKWYKEKGTYESIQTLALIQQFDVNFYDMYTDDYSNFYMVDWFVGDEDENPSGYDSSYYKSPHFGIEILLNKVFTVGSADYLWRNSYLSNLQTQIEKTRPVHTVPHYILLLNPKTDELGNIIEVDGEIQTKIHSAWQYSTKYFDMTGSDAWNFDDTTVFDASTTSFIESITQYKFGDGGAFGCTHPVVIGTIDVADITITATKVTFEFIIPKITELSGVNELGLYSSNPAIGLVLSSIFPKVDKDTTAQLRVVVEVHKEDLTM